MENFNLKKFLVENKLTTNSRMIGEEINPDIEDIIGWMMEQPVYNDVSPEEISQIAKEYQQEWEGSRDNFDSIHDYLDAVEQNQDYL